MIADDLLAMIKEVEVENVYLFFITRVLKPTLKKNSKALVRYSYKIYQIDINEEIQGHLYTLTTEQLSRLAREKPSIDDYDIITEDVGQLYRYELTAEDQAFNDLIDELYGTPPKIANLEQILKTEEIWAYCIGFEDLIKAEWFFTFRRIMSSKVATTERDNQQKNVFRRGLRTIFNTDSEKLEMLVGETVVLEKQIDFYLYDNVFYIARKGNFERIVGMQAEFKGEAESVVEQLEDTGMITGVNFIVKQIEENPAIHKKLIRIAKIGNYRSLTPAIIKKMKTVCKNRNLPLKIKAGKLVIENENDTELVLRMLADYYKTGDISGKPYGGYGGKEE